MNLKERKDYFIARAIAKHIDKYDYSESLYVRNNVKIKIKCNSCNKFFEQTPSNHLNGLSKFKGHMECRLPINFNAINEIINSTIKDIG